MTQREAPFTNETEARNCERVMGDSRHGLLPETNQQVWDQLYLSRKQLFSGEPNGVLIGEVVDLPPGQALDVGCGEGADARWLAERGWQVTAVDVSQVALERAAREAGGNGVAWTRADLSITAPPAAAFDLVSAQYFPLLHEPGHTALRGLLAAVAPGGTFLFVSHDPGDLRTDHGFDPSDYYHPYEIAVLLDDDWAVLVDETRPRTAPPPPGTHHAHDTVLRAKRLR